MSHFERSVDVDVPVRALFDWHTRAGALPRMLPPFEAVAVEQAPERLENGARVVLRPSAGPFKLRWVADHRDVRAPDGFVDEQTSGPFARWVHEHRMSALGDDRSRLVDHVDYRLPLEPLSRWIAGGAVRAKLERMFAYRHRVLRDDLASQARCASWTGRVGITGASGLIGSALCAYLSTAGLDVVRFVRRAAQRPDEREWQPLAPSPRAFEGLDAVVHLAGENVAGGRWTAKRRRALVESRVEPTRLLSAALARADGGPRVLVCSSGAGYYDSASRTHVDEDAPPGESFLSRLAVDWEAATQPAADAGVRVVKLRTGIVLTPAGGALAKLLPAFRWGAGGRVGSGEQGFSWITLDDVLSVVHHALATPSLDGPLNLSAPEAVSQHDFARALGRVLRRPTIAPLPSVVVKLLFGEMGEALLLRGPFLIPRRLADSGFVYRYPSLDGALRHVLGRAPLSDTRGTPRGSTTAT